MVMGGLHSPICSKQLPPSPRVGHHLDGEFQHVLRHTTSQPWELHGPVHAVAALQCVSVPGGQNLVQIQESTHVVTVFSPDSVSGPLEHSSLKN